MLSDLNPAQREAVLTVEGPLLVLAGAGTGKTRVITYRMVELIRKGIPPEKILSVTFTNKAAREMRERMHQLLPVKRGAARPLISTFHSLCVRILREEIEVLGYPKRFAIFDRGDQESAARSVLRAIRVTNQTMKPADLINRISNWKSSGLTPAEASVDAESDLDYLSAVGYRKYQSNLKASGALDFDDLLMLTNQLFHSFPDVLQRQRQRFRFVQIDEYQDTNRLQFELVQQLVQEHTNLCVVGDDDQSIYGWRGAEVKHILSFQSHFPSAKIVRLQDNYRCTEDILRLANTLVRHNIDRHEKRLVAHKPSQIEVRFVEFEDEQQEAESIVKELKYLIEDHKIAPGQFAILFRTNEQPRLFETEFRRFQIPYQLVGGQSFFDRREIRDVMAYLKAMCYPQEEVSLLRIINTPTRGIGAGSVEKILTQAVTQKIDFWNSAKLAAESGLVSPRVQEALQSFHHKLQNYREKFSAPNANLAELTKAWLKEIQYEAEIEKQYNTPEQQELRKELLEQFVQSMDDWSRSESSNRLQDFLDEMTLSDRNDESELTEEDHQQAVKLMTLHSAKGLEFPRVYLVGMEEGLLPHRRAVEIGTRAAIAEERRLTYVGITRAMDQLTITRAASRTKWGKKRPSPPSRFLFEMQADQSGEQIVEGAQDHGSG